MRMRAYFWIILFTVPIVIVINSCIREENDLASRECTTTCTTIIGTITFDNGTMPLSGVRLTANYETWQRLIFIARTKDDVVTNSAGEFRMDFEIRDDEMTAGGFLL